MEGNYQKKGIERKSTGLVGKFFKTFFAVFFIIVLVATAVILGYTFANPDAPNPFDPPLDITGKPKKDTSLGIFDSMPETTTVLLVGVDVDQTRTDTMIIAHYVKTGDKLTLISVPRDSWVQVPQERLDILDSKDRWYPSGGWMKLNEIHSYAGKDIGMQFLQEQLEEMLNIEINYYVKVNLDGFVSLVDQIGGIDYDVPYDMYHHDDTPGYEQLINLKKGMQHLDGEQAKNMVRFRSSSTGEDIGRMNVQKDFIKAVLAKLLSGKDIIKTINALINVGWNYVNTDLSMTELGKYANEAQDMDYNNIELLSIPGEVGRAANGQSIVSLDLGLAKEMIDKVFYSTPEQVDESANSTTQESETESQETSTESENTINSDISDIRVQVQNGGTIAGLAGKKKDMLIEEGFKVLDATTYNGTKDKQTRIYVKKKENAEEIKKFFVDSKVVLDSTMDKNYDVIIVLGTDER